MAAGAKEKYSKIPRGLPMAVELLKKPQKQCRMSVTHCSSAAVWLLVACRRLLITIMGYVTIVATILAEAPVTKEYKRMQAIASRVAIWRDFLVARDSLVGLKPLLVSNSMCIYMCIGMAD